MYVTVTGQQQNKYLGLYSVVENPDEAFFEAHGLPGNGAIFKPVTRSLFSDAGPDWAAYNQAYDPKTKLTDAQKQRVIDLARLVTSADDGTFVREIGSYVDLDAAARYLAVCVFLVDLDGLLQHRPELLHVSEFDDQPLLVRAVGSGPFVGTVLRRGHPAAT